MLMEKKVKVKTKVKVGVAENVGADAALAMLTEAAIQSGVGYVKHIRQIILRKLNSTEKYYFIPVLDENGKPLEDKHIIAYIAGQVNSRNRKHNTAVRIKWIESNEKGEMIRKFLAMPADKYKDFLGRI